MKAILVAKDFLDGTAGEQQLLNNITLAFEGLIAHLPNPHPGLTYVYRVKCIYNHQGPTTFEFKRGRTMRLGPAGDALHLGDL